MRRFKSWLPWSGLVGAAQSRLFRRVGGFRFRVTHVLHEFGQLALQLRRQFGVGGEMLDFAGSAAGAAPPRTSHWSAMITRPRRGSRIRKGGTVHSLVGRAGVTPGTARSRRSGRGRSGRGRGRPVSGRPYQSEPRTGRSVSSDPPPKVVQLFDDPRPSSRAGSVRSKSYLDGSIFPPREVCGSEMEARLAAWTKRGS